jgi:pimeloyl-ACP methyl ester carboxylesterase
MLKSAHLAAAATAVAATAAWLLSPPPVPPLDVATSSIEDEEEETLGGVRVRHRVATLTSGARLHFIESGDANADAPIVLLLHGFPDSHLSWLPQLPALTGAGYRCICPDLRGYGRSSAPSSATAYCAAALVSDCCALLDVLQCVSAMVIGHDWGGAVAYAFASLAPGRVSRLVVLNCPHPRTFSRTLRSSGAQRLRSWYMLLFQLPLLPEMLLSAGDHTALRRTLATEPAVRPTDLTLVERYVQLYRCSGWRGPLNYYRSNIRMGGWKLPRTAIIDCPVLVLWGTGDRHLLACMADPGEAAPKARVVLIGSGAQHWVHWDAAAEVNAHLLSFLRDTQ